MCMLLLFVLIEGVISFIQCSKSLCPSKCEVYSCTDKQKLVPKGGFCGCCDACYDILSK